MVAGGFSANMANDASASEANRSFFLSNITIFLSRWLS
jgi:hypothetical protein